MKRTLSDWFKRVRRTTPQQTAPVCEGLEARRLLSADGPRVLSALADNRGQVTINFDQALSPATLTRSTVEVFVGKTAQKVYLALNKRRTTLTVTSSLKANSAYRLVLDASQIKGLYTGLALDGEFNKRGSSGNGKPGGNYDVTTTGVTAEATFSTVEGVINVNLLTTQTPKTYNNFLAYANAGLWDNTIFDANNQTGVYAVHGGALQANTLLSVIKTLPAVPIESGISNDRGTLAMYTADGTNDVNRWFFNTDDNGSTYNGTYTAFGRVADAASLTTLDALAKLRTVSLGGSVTALPVLNAAATFSTSNLATVYRVAMVETFYRTA